MQGGLALIRGVDVGDKAAQDVNMYYLPLSATQNFPYVGSRAHFIHMYNCLSNTGSSWPREFALSTDNFNVLET